MISSLNKDESEFHTFCKKQTYTHVFEHEQEHTCYLFSLNLNRIRLSY